MTRSVRKQLPRMCITLVGVSATGRRVSKQFNDNRDMQAFLARCPMISYRIHR